MRYKCKKCGEQFEHESACAVHHMVEDHSEFEFIGLGDCITIKTPED